jgi:hypothetical protein
MNGKAAAVAKSAASPALIAWVAGEPAATAKPAVPRETAPKATLRSQCGRDQQSDCQQLHIDRVYLDVCKRQSLFCQNGLNRSDNER